MFYKSKVIVKDKDLDQITTRNLLKKKYLMTVIPRSKHNIAHRDISNNAWKVLHRLNRFGYEAYLVGGGVRDLLLRKKPQDFDITTNATPEQIRKLFNNCRLVGRRFRLAHIIFGHEIIEVATFRGHHDVNSNNYPLQQTKNGMLLQDNIFGSIEEDAQRRDFTINSLYYGGSDFVLRDYSDGLLDLKKGIIRLIGDPEVRYREDPVRMLRAVRFAAKLDMTISPETAEPIPRMASLLNKIPSARLFEETLKLLQGGYSYKSYLKLCEYQLFQPLFPLVSRYSTQHNNLLMERILIQLLKNTDYRLHHDQRVNPAFLFATILWYPLIECTQKLKQESILCYCNAFSLAIDNILEEANRSLAIPKRITMIVQDIWLLQLRFPLRQLKYVYQLMEHPKFRAAYDLLVLRAEIEKSYKLQSMSQWWSKFQKELPKQQQLMLETLTVAPCYFCCSANEKHKCYKNGNEKKIL